MYLGLTLHGVYCDAYADDILNVICKSEAGLTHYSDAVEFLPNVTTFPSAPPSARS